MRRTILFLSAILVIAASCNPSKPDRSICKKLEKIDKLAKYDHRPESDSLSFEQWKENIIMDFHDVYEIVSASPINTQRVKTFEARDGRVYPLDWMIQEKEVVNNIAHLVGLHDLLLQYLSQLKDKLILKEEVKNNREAYQTEDKYNATLSLVDESIKASAEKVIFANSKLKGLIPIE